METSQNKSQMIIYKSETGETKIDVRFENETVWLTQNALAELFQTTKQNIGQHIKNVIEEGELLENSTIKKFFTVQKEGNREVKRESSPNRVGNFLEKTKKYFARCWQDFA